MANVMEIGPEGQHEEQTAEQVFPLSNPGDRFDAERMHGEHGRHNCARQRLPVICQRTNSSRIATAACSTTLVK